MQLENTVFQLLILCRETMVEAVVCPGRVRNVSVHFTGF